MNWLMLAANATGQESADPQTWGAIIGGICAVLVSIIGALKFGVRRERKRYVAELPDPDNDNSVVKLTLSDIFTQFNKKFDAICRDIKGLQKGQTEQRYILETAMDKMTAQTQICDQRFKHLEDKHD